MKLNDQTVSILCKALEAGMSVVACCGIAGISESTFYRWRKEHPHFQIAIQASQYNFELNAVEAIKRAGEKDWRAWAWLLERRFPKSWKNYQEVNIVSSQSDGTSVVISMLEQIAKKDKDKVAKESC